MGKPRQPGNSIQTMLAAVTAVVVMTGALSATGTARAQDTLVIGGVGGPSVEVDLRALDGLPDKPTLPELLRGRRAPSSAFGRGLRLPGESFSPVRVHRNTVQPGQLGARAFDSGTTAERKPAPRVPVKAAKKAETSGAGAVPAKPKIAAAPSVAPPPKVRIEAPAPTQPVKARTRPPVTKTASKPPKPASSPTKTTSVPKARTPPPPPKIAAVKPVKVPAKPKVAAVKPPAPPKPPTTIASVPAANGEALQVPFAAGASSLPGAVASKLDGVVRDLMANEGKRVQLMAYATAPDGNSSKARRLSLSRALSVRSYLMSKGVRSTRMDVRALGDRVKSGPSDRVDVIVVTR